MQFFRSTVSRFQALAAATEKALVAKSTVGAWNNVVAVQGGAQCSQ